MTSHETDWDGFRVKPESLIEFQVPLTSPEQLEKEVKFFVDNMQQAAWINTLAKRRKYNNIGINYPLEVQQLVSKKIKVRKTWQNLVHHNTRQ